MLHTSNKWANMSCNNFCFLKTPTTKQHWQWNSCLSNCNLHTVTTDSRLTLQNHGWETPRCRCRRQVSPHPPKWAKWFEASNFTSCFIEQLTLTNNLDIAFWPLDPDCKHYLYDTGFLKLCGDRFNSIWEVSGIYKKLKWNKFSLL